MKRQTVILGGGASGLAAAVVAVFLLLFLLQEFLLFSLTLLLLLSEFLLFLLTLLLSQSLLILLRIIDHGFHLILLGNLLCFMNGITLPSLLHKLGILRVDLITEFLIVADNFLVEVVEVFI